MDHAGQAQQCDPAARLGVEEVADPVEDGFQARGGFSDRRRRAGLDVDDKMQGPQDQPLRHQGVVTHAVVEAGQGGQGNGATECGPTVGRMRSHQLPCEDEVHADAEEEPGADILKIDRQDVPERLEDKGEKRVGVGIENRQACRRVQQRFVIARRPRRVTESVPSQDVLTPIGLHQPADTRRDDDFRGKEGQEQQDRRDDADAAEQSVAHCGHGIKPVYGSAGQAPVRQTHCRQNSSGDPAGRSLANLMQGAKGGSRSAAQ